MTDKLSLRPRLDSQPHEIAHQTEFQNELNAISMSRSSTVGLPAGFPSVEIHFGGTPGSHGAGKSRGESGDEVDAATPSQSVEGEKTASSRSPELTKSTTLPSRAENSLLGISLQLVRLSAEGAAAELREKPLTTAALLVGGTAIGLAAAATLPVWATSSLAIAGLGYAGYSLYNGIRSNAVAISSLWRGRESDPVGYDAAQEQLKHALGPVAIDAAAGLLFGGASRLTRIFRPSTSVIAGAVEQSPAGMRNLINPPVNGVNRMDNCIACTGAVLTNKLERNVHPEDLVSAHTIEQMFGYTGKERSLNIVQAQQYLERVVGAPLSNRQMPFMDPNVAPGHYAIFWGRKPNYVHVTYGEVLPDGTRYIFDGQLGGRNRTWEEMAQRYGGGNARRVEIERAGS